MLKQDSDDPLRIHRTPSQLRREWERLTQDPDLLDIICENVATGGSMLTLSKLWQIPYGWMTTWVHNDKERFKRYRAALDARAEYTIELVLDQLRSIATSSVVDLYDENGALKPLHELPEHVAKSIHSIEVSYESQGEGEPPLMTKKIKLHDKVKGIDLLGKTLSMFTVKHVVNDVRTLEDIIAESYKVEDTEQKQLENKDE